MIVQLPPADPPSPGVSAGGFCRIGPARTAVSPARTSSVQDRRGRVVAHGDLGWRRWRVLVEHEGAGHAGRGRFAADIERCTQLTADGWLVLRSGRAHLGRPWAVLDRCERALRSRGWRPGLS